MDISEHLFHCKISKIESEFFFTRKNIFLSRFVTLYLRDRISALYFCLLVDVELNFVCLRSCSVMLHIFGDKH